MTPPHQSEHTTHLGKTNISRKIHALESKNWCGQAFGNLGKEIQFGIPSKQENVYFLFLFSVISIKTKANCFLYLSFMFS